MLAPALLFAAACAGAPPDPGPSPRAVAASLAVGPGLRVELAAAEPLVVDPVAVRFDERGRAWVVEMPDYPEPPPGGFSESHPPRGRVRILEDTTGDGAFDAATTFADGLVFATGVQPWRGGAFVTLAGKVGYFPDADRDGAADGEEVWFAGFAEENEQLRANHPTLGPDGLIYVGNGLRGGKITLGDANPLSRTHASGLGGEEEGGSLDLSGRTFAFDPRTGAATVVAGAGQYGLSIDDFGDRFFCENRLPVRHAALPDALTALNPHHAAPDPVHDVAAGGPDSTLYATQNGFTTSLAHAGQFTAACGVLRFDGSALGNEYRGDFFTCEPTAGLVHREVPRPRGATFTSSPGREGAEFLTGAEPYFRPVDLAAGPDGALYICDMARAVIEHPRWMPDELKDRPDLRDGDTLGRLWRVRAAGEAVRFDPAAFADRSPAALAAKLNDPNGWVRATASRLLFEARDAAAVGAVRGVLFGPVRPEARALALHYLAAVGGLTDADVRRALANDSADPRVRGLTARLAPAGEASAPLVAVLNRELGRPDADGRLRFDLCLALAPHADDPAVFDALVAAAVRSEDPYLHAAVLAGAGRGDRPVSLTAALWRSDPPAPPGLLGESAEIAGRRGEVAATMGMAVGETLAEPSPGVSPRAAAVLRGLDETAHTVLRRAFAEMSDADRSKLTANFAAAVETAADRPAAVFLLDLLPETRPALAALAADDAVPAVRAAAARRLANVRPNPDAADPAVELIRNLPGETPAVRAALLDLGLTTPARSAALLDLAEAGELTAAALGPARVRRLKDAGGPLGERATAALRSASADRAAVLARYADCLTLEGDLERGRAVFARACATCHAVDGVGAAVGADVSDTYKYTPESLLTHILDPNRAVDAGGFAYTILTADGRAATGLLTAETAGSVTLTSPGGESVTLPRSEVLELRSEGVSLMPAGLEHQVSEPQMADLIAFLKGWRYGG